MFKYGSVIEQSAENKPLLQSIPGNQVRKIHIINIKENIDKVWPRTAKISDNIIPS